MSNKELAKELHKSIIKKLEKGKVSSSFIDNIWGSDHADIELISKVDKKTVFYYVLLIFSVKMEGFFFKREKIYYNYCFSKNFKRA